MNRYAFARRPKWIAAHVFILGAVSLFVMAGFWQLSRLEERRAHNALVRERRELPPVTVLPGLDEEQRRVRLEGRYDERQVVLTGRPFRGSPGDHLLTPLVTGDGGAVLVDRGWVPPGEVTPPPDGTVTVEGIVLPSQGRAVLGGSGGTDRMSRIDIERIDEQSPLDLALVYVLLQRQTPSQRVPRPAEPAGLSEGSHLSYAVQWFSFVAVALVVYGALLRREARKQQAEVFSGRD